VVTRHAIDIKIHKKCFEMGLQGQLMKWGYASDIFSPMRV